MAGSLQDESVAITLKRLMVAVTFQRPKTRMIQMEDYSMRLSTLLAVASFVIAAAVTHAQGITDAQIAVIVVTANH